MWWLFAWVVGCAVCLILTDKRVVSDKILTEYVGPWVGCYPKWRILTCLLWVIVIPLLVIVHVTLYIVFKFIEDDDDEDDHLGV